MVISLLSMEGQKALRFHHKYLNLCSEDERRFYCVFTPDATCANKSRYSRVVGHLNILSLLASFAREIHFTTDGSCLVVKWLKHQLVSRKVVVKYGE